MSIPPYGSESFLRFQLRHKIRVLKEDDQRILWEGIDSLTKMELREACQERGMRSTGLSKEAYKRNLQQWLDLSVNKKVPASLLIMSRTFFLRDESEPSQPGDEEKKDLSGLADAISSLDKEVLNEVILEMATQKESSDPEIRKIKLEVLNKQNELIREELEAREAAEKKKKEKDAADAAEKKAAAETKEAEEADAATIFSTKDIPIPSEEVKLAKEAGGAEEKQKNEQDDHLSTHEMDALSQLVSDDPVSKERAELQKIKSAMVEKDEPTVQDDVVPSESLEQAFFDSSQPLTSKQADQIAQALVEDIKEIVRHDGTTTQISMDGKLTPESIPTTRKEQEEEYVDPVVSRLKQRIESMVDKIEIQLSEAEVKIGDKLHLLDKDRDGVLSQSEMASVLQQVLKRDVSFDEAMDIARAMDANNDGVFTVDELIKWINEHKLVKYAKEDRDDEMDRIMESQAESAKEGEAKQAEEAKKAKQGTTEAPKMG
jgi:LETM1 and EF-hand domain-containing protein 1